MAELKTKKTDASVKDFLAGLTDEVSRSDCDVLLKVFTQATGSTPKLWGSAIIGFGDVRYKYATGRQGDWFLTGFSPRKQNLTLYAIGGGWDEKLLAKLGKHTVGSGCLYVKRLANLDMDVLKALITKAITHGRSVYRDPASPAPAATALSVSEKAKAVGNEAKPSAKRVVASAKAKSDGRIEVHNVNSPGHVVNVDARMYAAMKTALLKALPRKAPGLSQAEMLAGLLPHLPEVLFPGGAKAGWWMKCVQLDLEAKDALVREASKPLRWHRK